MATYIRNITTLFILASDVSAYRANLRANLPSVLAQRASVSPKKACMSAVSSF